LAGREPYFRIFKPGDAVGEFDEEGLPTPLGARAWRKRRVAYVTRRGRKQAS